jgi:hypothetical protein
MADIQCPTIGDFLDTQACFDNFAGLGSVIYVFLKSDLAAPLALTDNVYATPTFKSGKGLYKIECKDENQEIPFESLGKTKGFKLTLNFTIDAVNKLTSKLGRAFNNLDLGFIVPDGADSQILYDPQRKVKFDSGGIKGSTGKAAADERKTDFVATLSPVPFTNLYVTNPTTGGWDSLLASGAAAHAG